MTWRQLDGGKRTFKRVEQLILFAQGCGMTFDHFGIQAVQRMIETMVSFGVDHFQGLAQRENEVLLEDLWRCLLRLHGGRLDRVPETIRNSLLRFQSDLARRSGSSRIHQERTKRAISILRDFLEIEGGFDVGNIAGDVLQLRNPKDGTELWVERLHILGRALSNGVNIPFGALVSIFARALHAFERNEVERPDKLLALTVEEVCSSLYGSHSGAASTKMRWHVQHALQRYVRRTLLQSSFHSVHKGERLLKNRSTPTPAIIKQAIAILSSLHLDSEDRVQGQRPQITFSCEAAHAFDVALSLFERVAHRPFVDVHVLVATIVRTLLDMARNAETEDSAVILTTRFARILTSADLFPHVDDHLVHLVFDLLASAAPRSETAYRLARLVYARARAMQDFYKWTASPASDDRWRALYRLALTRDGPKHLHFASRLYADRLADGRPIYRQDMLLFIRTIGGSDNDSKFILLERHLKDYLYFGYGNIQGFCIAMVKGLTASFRGRDAWMGFHLARRILLDKPFPTQIFSMVLRALSRSQDDKDLQRLEEVLVYAPTPSRRRFFDLVLRTIQAEIDPEAAPDSREYTTRLATMISLYTNMTRQGIKPTDATVHAIIQVLARSQHISHATKIVENMLENGTMLPLDTIALVIRRLEEIERFDDAERLKARFHSVKNSTASRGTIMALSEYQARGLLLATRKNRNHYAGLQKAIKAVELAKVDLEYTALVDSPEMLHRLDKLIRRLKGALGNVGSASKLLASEGDTVSELDIEELEEADADGVPDEWDVAQMDGVENEDQKLEERQDETSQRLN